MGFAISIFILVDPGEWYIIDGEMDRYRVDQIIVMAEPQTDTPTGTENS